MRKDSRRLPRVMCYCGCLCTVLLVEGITYYRNVTVLLTIPAIGAKLPTVILWPSKTVPQELAELRAYDILVLPNEGGWQTITSFEFIMRKIIIPAIVNKRKFLNYENENALLVLDSHSSRFNSQV